MTTKIQFKLSNDVLLTIIKMIEQTNGFIVHSIDEALLISIKEDLLVKLEDKAKTIQKQTSILDHNKKHIVVLKYHEAYTMYKLIDVAYCKETFEEHLHFKKIKRLLIDLENKVTNFDTEQPLTIDKATIPQETIIEEITIPEQDYSVILTEDNNQGMDLVSLEEVKNISVDNYSIFNLFDNDTFKENKTEKSTLDQIAEQTIETNALKGEITSTNESIEEKAETVSSEEERTQSIKTINAVIEQTIEKESIEKDLIQSNKIIEKSVNNIIVNNPSVSFNGVVSKSSISIETEKEQNNSLESIFEPVQFNEKISLFEEIETVNTPEKEEKIKREKKKKSKGDSSEGQISLF